MKRPLLFLTLLLSLGSAALAQDVTGPSPAELRMREALKNALLQLRAAQEQSNTLQVSLDEATSARDTLKADLKAQADKLNKQIKEITQQGNDAKDASDKTIASLNGKVTDLEAQVTRLNASIEKWKAGYTQVADIAKTKEFERARLAIQTVELERKVADYSAKNAELYRVGRDILVRYEKFGLGEALTSQEPFVGTTRTKMENLVQDFADKLDDQKLVTKTPSTETAPVEALPDTTTVPEGMAPAPTTMMPSPSQSPVANTLAPANPVIVDVTNRSETTNEAQSRTEAMAAETRLVEEKLRTQPSEQQRVDPRFLLPNRGFRPLAPSSSSSDQTYNTGSIGVSPSSNTLP